MPFLTNIAYSLARVYWFIFRPKTFGVRCIVERDGEVVMVKHTYGKRTDWLFPGGGIKRGETEKGAAQREVLEEVGIVAFNLKKSASSK